MTGACKHGAAVKLVQESVDTGFGIEREGIWWCRDCGATKFIPVPGGAGERHREKHPKAYQWRPCRLAKFYRKAFRDAVNAMEEQR